MPTRRRTRRACSGRALDVLRHIDQSLDRRDTLIYPFPVSPDYLGRLQLPADGLSRAEADRLKLYIESLVTE